MEQYIFKTPLREKKQLIVPPAPKKQGTDNIDRAIASGHITVRRGPYWSAPPIFDYNSE